MLGKLLKHEMLYNIKKFVPMYIAYFAVAAVLRVMTLFNINIDNFGESGTSIVMGMTYIVLMIFFMFGIFGLMLYAIFGNVSRFHKNLFTDEGYLMNTLPVPSYCHILCKLISGLIWYALSSAAAIGGFAVAFADIEDFTLFPSYEMFSKIISENLLETLLAFALSVVCYCAFLLLCYMSEGIVSMMGNKKFIASIIVIVCIIINSIIVSFISVIAADGSLENSETSSVMMLLNVVRLVYYVVVSAILFLITNSLLTKHLNLE